MGNIVYSYEQLQDMINPIIKKYKASGAYLFGSYARKEAIPSSDIDLIVIGGSNFERTNIFAIAEELHIMSGKRVDVYEISEINEGSSFYKRIMKERIRVQ